MCCEFIAGIIISLTGLPNAPVPNQYHVVKHFLKSCLAFMRGLLFNPKEQTDNNNYFHAKTKQNIPDDKTAMFCMPCATLHR